jgi:hypothetical protein
MPTEAEKADLKVGAAKYELRSIDRRHARDRRHACPIGRICHRPRFVVLTSLLAAR